MVDGHRPLDAVSVEEDQVREGVATILEVLLPIPPNDSLSDVDPLARSVRSEPSHGAVEGRGAVRARLRAESVGEDRAGRGVWRGEDVGGRGAADREALASDGGVNATFVGDADGEV